MPWKGHVVSFGVWSCRQSDEGVYLDGDIALPVVLACDGGSSTSEQRPREKGGSLQLRRFVRDAIT
jgi:hypothetical protein